MKSIGFLIVFSFFFPACAQENADFRGALHYYFPEPVHKSFPLPKKLDEISGLTMTDDGRLLAHNDEEGTIFQIDFESGRVVKEFQVGDKKISEDFEGIALAGQNIFLVSSSGDLYSFLEGSDGSQVEYTRYKTVLSASSDVEGLCYDPQTNSLLLACKGDPGKGFKNKKAIYSLALESMKIIPDPRFLLDASLLSQSDKYALVRKIGAFFLLPTQKNFSPSGITRHPQSGTFFILSANSPVIVEVSSAGEIIGINDLDSQSHPQPEGITIAPDLSLIIADEGKNSNGRITIYLPKKAE